MADLLLDSDVVIWHLRGKRPVVDLVVKLARSSRLGVSAIVRAEVTSGMREGERASTIAFLDACETVPVGAATADRAGELIREKRARGVTLHLPDALIAAGAIILGIPLYTCDPRHYAVSGLDVRAVDV